MSTTKTPKRPKKRRSKARCYGTHQPAESRPAEVMTIAWTVAVASVLLCDLLAVAAHLLTRVVALPDQLELLVRLLLVAGGIVGLLSLALIPVVIRLRHVPPPSGFLAFSVFVAIAPILALICLATFS